MSDKKEKKETKFAKESAEQQATSTAMIALFKPEGGEKLKGLTRRNAPQMVKPDQVPIGGLVSGVIVDIMDSPVSTIKGKLLWLRHESGVEFTFPCTGVIRNALAPGKKEAELEAALKKEVGKMFYAVRQPNKSSKYKKEMFMFDVYTADK